MNRITNPLYHLLMQAENYPQLLFAEKSLLALDNFITGYVTASNSLSKSDSLQQWYDLFCNFVCESLGETGDRRDVRAVILEHGFDDTTGVDYFYSMLKQFVQSVSEKPAAPMESLSQEVRALRFSPSAVYSLAQREICAHPERYFGIEQHESADTSCYYFSCDKDGKLHCLVYNQTTGILLPAVLEKALDNVPVIDELQDIGRTEPYKVIKYTTQSDLDM